MESFWQDVRYAVRQLRTQRQFTIAALLVLGLGIGANATIFTVVDRVLLSPLPYRAPGDLVMIWERNARGNVEHNVVSPQNYLDWKERATSFTDLADFTWSSMTLLGGTAPEHVYGRSRDAEPLLSTRHRSGTGPDVHRGRVEAGRAERRDPE